MLLHTGILAPEGVWITLQALASHMLAKARTAAQELPSNQSVCGMLCLKLAKTLQLHASSVMDRIKEEDASAVVGMLNQAYELVLSLKNMDCMVADKDRAKHLLQLESKVC